MNRILIMHQTITNHDAIGNDIECMYNILKQKHYCRCFAENRFNSRLMYADIEEAKEILKDKDGIVIFHHSVNWPFGYELIKNIQAKLVFRYHNITPPDFFAPYNKDYTISCTLGRQLTDILIEEFPTAFWLSDSQYNCNDLQNVDMNKIDICPPLHKVEEWTHTLPDEQILSKLVQSTEINVLFVGRVAPNKGHTMLLEIINAYCCNFGSNIKLYVIGKFDEGLPQYNELITKTIKKYHIDRNVVFIGEINDATLMAYYLGCDVFLCTSDHEGFCVPIIEAQKLQLPIICKNSCAVPETIGKNQIILDEEVNEYAAAIHLIVENQQARQYLRENGVINYENNFSYHIIEQKFMRFMKERMGLPL